ncbi:MAG: hypothetical protein ACXADC_03080 [Candidatus Thorarchaeota archaeon]|jgi:hypothetical protein
MPRFRRASNTFAAVIAVMILLSCFQVSVSAQADLDPIVVLYDAEHSPQFSATDEEDGLKLMLDMVNASTKYIVKINTNPIRNHTLSDVDVLIVASPDRSNEFTLSEVAAIEEMMNNGSSLMLLGDPTIGQNSTYWGESQFQDLGETIALNRLLDSLNITGPRFSVNFTEDGDRYWGDALFDLNQTLNETSPWVINLDSSTWDQTHPIFKNINELVLMTATLKPLPLVSSIATGYETSFAQYKRSEFSMANYTYINETLFAENPLSYSAINGSFPSWMSAFEYNQTRVVLSGSTIMFSGRTLDIDGEEGQWFYQADNSRLFMNMLDWLSEDFVDAPEAITPMFIISSTILVVGVVFYILRKIR